MTEQVPESLVYQGKTWMMESQPLADFFLLQRVPSPYSMSSTACWRGYVGHWAIKEECLYLEEIRPEFPGHRLLTVEDLFPEATGPVLVDWYTGALILLDELDRSSLGCSTEGWKRPALALDIARGRFVGRRIVDNPSWEDLIR